MGAVFGHEHGQNTFAQPAIGWALLIPALAVLVLVFTPPVVQATKRT